MITLSLTTEQALALWHTLAMAQENADCLEFDTPEERTREHANADALRPIEAELSALFAGETSTDSPAPADRPTALGPMEWKRVDAGEYRAGEWSLMAGADASGATRGPWTILHDGTELRTPSKRDPRGYLVTKRTLNEAMLWVEARGADHLHRYR